MKRLTIAVCAMSTLFMASPALADVVVTNPDRIEYRSKIVYLTGLDLRDANDLDTLNTRLDRAVRFVCGSADVRRLDEMADMNRCRAESQDRAYADRDAILAARMAARDDPVALARLDTISLRITR